MGFIEWTKGLFGSNEEPQERAVSDGDAFLERLEMLLQDYTAGDLNEKEIEDAMHENPVLYSCVSLISTAIANADIHITRNGKRVPHEIDRLLDRPNKFHTRYTFFWLLSAYLLTLGKVFIYRLPNGQLLPVSPNKVEKDGKHYQITIGSQTHKAYIDEDLVRITLPDLRQPYTAGSGYGSVLGQEIDISESAASHEAGHLRNHARPDLLINFKGLKEDPLKQIKEDHEKRHKGADKSGKVGFSNAERMDVKVLTSSFKDLGLIDLRKHSHEVVRQTFGIPATLLGAKENLQRAGLEADEYIFSKYVVEPKLYHILSELTVKLIPLMTTQTGLAFDAESIVPKDKQHALNVAKAFSGGVPAHMTTNEARAMQGLDPIPGGDVLGGGISAQQPQEEPEGEEERTPLMRMKPSGSKLERLNFDSLFKELSNKSKI